MPELNAGTAGESSGDRTAQQIIDATRAQLSWMEAAESEVAQDDLQALLMETRGVVEKLAEGNLKLGSWQMVLWQPRWVFATTDAVCYQKITSDERPIGKEKKINFTDILKIDELDYGEFQLEVARRFYTFKAPTSQKCTVFVNNLRTLQERNRLELARRAQGR